MNERDTPLFKNDLTPEQQAEQDRAFEEEQAGRKKADIILSVADITGLLLEFLGGLF